MAEEKKPVAAKAPKAEKAPKEVAPKAEKKAAAPKAEKPEVKAEAPKAEAKKVAPKAEKKAEKAASSEEKYENRLIKKYHDQVVPTLIKKFGYTSVMQARNSRRSSSTSVSVMPPSTRKRLKTASLNSRPSPDSIR
jgi:hypothetical protein